MGGKYVCKETIIILGFVLKVKLSYPASKELCTLRTPQCYQKSLCSHSLHKTNKHVFSPFALNTFCYTSCSQALTLSKELNMPVSLACAKQGSGGQDCRSQQCRALWMSPPHHCSAWQTPQSSLHLLIIKKNLLLHGNSGLCFQFSC